MPTATCSSRPTPTPREVETPQAAFQLLQMLRGVTQRGTGAAGRAA